MRTEVVPETSVILIKWHGWALEKILLKLFAAKASDRARIDDCPLLTSQRLRMNFLANHILQTKVWTQHSLSLALVTPPSSFHNLPYKKLIFTNTNPNKIIINTLSEAQNMHILTARSKMTDSIETWNTWQHKKLPYHTDRNRAHHTTIPESQRGQVIQETHKNNSTTPITRYNVINIPSFEEPHPGRSHVTPEQREFTRLMGRTPGSSIFTWVLTHSLPIT
jgi:hypothetical protein